MDYKPEGEELYEIASAATQQRLACLYTDWETCTPEHLVETFRQNISKSMAFNPSQTYWWVEIDNGTPGHEAFTVAIFGNGPTSQANARFFCTFNPVRVRMLLDEMRTQYEALARLTAQQIALDALLAERGEALASERERVAGLHTQIENQAAIILAERDAATDKIGGLERELADVKKVIAEAKATYERGPQEIDENFDWVTEANNRGNVILYMSWDYRERGRLIDILRADLASTLAEREALKDHVEDMSTQLRIAEAAWGKENDVWRERFEVLAQGHVAHRKAGDTWVSQLYADLWVGWVVVSHFGSATTMDMIAQGRTALEVVDMVRAHRARRARTEGRDE